MQIREINGWFVIEHVGPSSTEQAVAGDDLAGFICDACLEPIEAGDLLAVVPLGPGKDAEQRRLCRAGELYDSQTAVVHRACATGEEA